MKTKRRNLLAASKRRRTAGSLERVVMLHCPECGKPVHKSNIEIEYHVGHGPIHVCPECGCGNEPADWKKKVQHNAEVSHGGDEKR